LRAGRVAWLPLVAGVLLFAGADVAAHRHDEYLQATRIAIDPAGLRLEVSLTPGIAVADAVIREIDTDADTLVTASEQRRYAEQLLRGLSVHLDGQPVPLTLASSSFPEAAALRGGDAFVTLRVDAVTPIPTAGAHRLSFRNRNAAHGAVYLANALLPEDDRVAITGMTHEVDQSGLTVAFTVRPARDWSSLWLGLFGPRVAR
jgi:hypothetical protein